MPPINSLMPLLGAAVHTVNALVEWLATYAIHSTILIGTLLVLSSTSLGRRLVAGNGSVLWRFALLGGLVTATVQSVRGTAPLAGTVRLDGDTQPQAMVKVEVHDDRNMVSLPAIDEMIARSPGLRFGALSPTAVVSSSISIKPLWPFVTVVAWLFIAGGLVAWFFTARSRFLRSIGPREPADHTLAGNTLRHLAREAGVQREIRLTLSDRLTSPVAIDETEICLPSRAMSELGPVRIESILAHELAHVIRRDPAWLTFSRVIEAIFFFQPLNVLARRRMQEAAEFASDAWASTRVTRPLDLAHCLARVAEWTIAAPRLPVPAMAERRGAVLVRRVERLTSGRVMHEVRPGRTARLAAVSALIGLVLLAPRAAVGAERSALPQFGVRQPNSLLLLRDVGENPTLPRGATVQREYLVVRMDKN